MTHDYMMKIPPTILIQETDFHSAWSRLIRYVLREGVKITIGDSTEPKKILDICATIELTGDAIRQIEDRELHPQAPFKRVDEYCKEFTREYQEQYLELEEDKKFVYTYFDRLTNYDITNMGYTRFTTDQIKMLDEYLADQIHDGISSNRDQAVTWRVDDDLGSASPPCFDDETEVLTSDGWKYFKAVTYDDEIASLSNGHELVYQHPTNIISYEYNGKMVSCEGTSLDFKVTPNHNMYVSPWYHDKFELIEADNLPKECYFKSDAVWNGTEQENILIGDKSIKMDGFLRFLAIYLADGSFTYTNKSKRIRFTTKCNIKLFKEILSDLHPDYNILEYNAECGTKNIDCVSLELHNKDLSSYVSQFGKSKDKFIPRWVMGLSSRQIKIFLDTAAFCDSSKQGKTVRYNTTSRRLADGMQELILKSGSECSCNIWKRNRIEYYEVKMAQYKNGIHLRRDRMIRNVDYNGLVSCVEVPNHVIYVRRNGKAMWCGNCLQRIWIRYLGDQSVEVHLTWRSRDGYGAFQANLIAIIDMINREILKPNNCKISKIVDFSNSFHIYHSDEPAARNVKLVPVNPLRYQDD